MRLRNNEKLVTTSIGLPESLHKKWRKHCTKYDVSASEYLRFLIANEMGDSSGIDFLCAANKWPRREPVKTK